MTPMIGYLRVSTDDQATNGYGLDAQRAALDAAASSRNWSMTWITDSASGKSTNRPGLQDALHLLTTHTALGIAVAKLDRLSRSMLDFASLLALAQKGHWTIVALDLGVDTSSPAGEMMANVIMAFAQYERRLISQRTTAALTAAKARGIHIGNPHLGKTPPHTRRLIHHLYAYGHSRSAIARHLNATHTPTPQGAPSWRPSSVAAVLKTVE